LASSPSKAYAKAIEIIFDGNQRRDLYTDWGDLRAALLHLGISHADRIHRHRSWDAIQTLSIVKCGKTGESGEYWHWVVYDGRVGLLYDPLRSAPSRPDGRTRKPRSHLPIGWPAIPFHLIPEQQNARIPNCGFQPNSW
jgi:hypothetical protein